MTKERRAGSANDPASGVQPEDLLHFVETDEFGDDWAELGLDVEIDLLAAQAMIMRAPEVHPIMKGTGGLRKARFAPASSMSGKSGAIRVCYAYFKEHWTVLLVMAYRKGRKENISKQEGEGIRRYLSIIKKYLDDRQRGKQ